MIHLTGRKTQTLTPMLQKPEGFRARRQGCSANLETSYLVPIHKWPICPISALREKFNPRNINHMPAVKFFARLDLDQIGLFLDGYCLITALSIL
jgi:hypothetical protein